MDNITTMNITFPTDYVTLTTQEKYTMLITETARETSNIIFDTIILTSLLSFLLGVFFTVLFKKDIIKLYNWLKNKSY